MASSARGTGGAGGTATCRVVLPADAPDATAARVLVEIRDTSVADAASVVLGSCELLDVPLTPGGALPPVEVDVADHPAAASLTVRVHVDLAGTGEVSSGDLLTTQSVPVLTRGAPADVEVPVTRV